MSGIGIAWVSLRSFPCATCRTFYMCIALALFWSLAFFYCSIILAAGTSGRHLRRGMQGDGLRTGFAVGHQCRRGEGHWCVFSVAHSKFTQSSSHTSHLHLLHCGTTGRNPQGHHFLHDTAIEHLGQESQRNHRRSRTRKTDYKFYVQSNWWLGEPLRRDSNNICLQECIFIFRSLWGLVHKHAPRMLCAGRKHGMEYSWSRIGRGIALNGQRQRRATNFGFFDSDGAPSAATATNWRGLYAASNACRSFPTSINLCLWLPALILHLHCYREAAMMLHVLSHQ